MTTREADKVIATHVPIRAMGASLRPSNFALAGSVNRAHGRGAF
jgi:hypothetical protein